MNEKNEWRMRWDDKKNNGRDDDDGLGRSGWLVRLKFPSRTGDVPL